MADFFDDNVADDTTADTPSDLISVGDKQYSQDDLSRLVQLGEIGLEAEEKYNTKLDKVWPEFSKTKNELKDMQDKLDAREAEKQAPAVDLPIDQRLAREQAIQAAKDLGIATTADMLTIEDVKSAIREEAAAQDLLNQSSTLATKYDGSDGRPSFVMDEVLHYMQDNGVRSPETAYKLMHEDKLDAWKEQKLSSSKKPGIMTDRGSAGGNTQPPRVTPTLDNLDELVREALSDGDPI